jgi:hypothetical protein
MIALTPLIATISGTLATVGLLVAGFVALILGWIIHPYTVGELTRWVESPIQQFIARVGTAIFAAIFAVVGGLHLLSKMFPNSASPTTATQVAEVLSPPNSTADQFAEPAEHAIAMPTTPSQPVVRVEQASSDHTPSQSIVSPEPPKTVPRAITTTRSAADIAEAPREKTSSMSDSEGIKSQTDSVQLKVAELKGELVVIDKKIQTERRRWQEGVGIINRLTNFKKTPVREGSPQYHQCMAASQVIKEVEAGSAGLKSEKARLEAMINSLEGK